MNNENNSKRGTVEGKHSGEQENNYFQFITRFTDFHSGCSHFLLCHNYVKNNLFTDNLLGNLENKHIHMDKTLHVISVKSAVSYIRKHMVTIYTSHLSNYS